MWTLTKVVLVDVSSLTEQLFFIRLIWLLTVVLLYSHRSFGHWLLAILVVQTITY
jgi:hypothetical protein